MTNLSAGTATAQAHPNIAFIKYWGNRDELLRLPSNSSISMNLDGLYTRTTVTFSDAPADTLTLNGDVIKGPALKRIQDSLDILRAMAGITAHAHVDSENNFPSGAGIASSASAFAALALAASRAAGLELSERDLSALARRGSGSAARSVPGGFVEWQAQSEDGDSYAFSIADPGHWDLVDCIAVVSAGHKVIGSTEGHRLAPTSPLQPARLGDTPRRLDLCRHAIRTRDIGALASVIELDSDIMHAVMMTSAPPLHYWKPASLLVMQEVRLWRAAGLPAAYTVDAGPNVHVICSQESSRQVERKLRSLPGVEKVLRAGVGGPARLVTG
jgi:diphosphomevalonate decarboxylase